MSRRMVADEQENGSEVLGFATSRADGHHGPGTLTAGRANQSTEDVVTTGVTPVAWTEDKSTMTQSEVLMDRVSGQASSRRPNYMVFCLALADAVSLVVSVALAVMLKWIFSGPLDLGAYLQLWPFVIVFLMAYAGMGLYSDISLGSPEEVRRLTMSSITVFLFVAMMTISYRESNKYFTLTMTAALLFSVVLVPLVRSCLRMKLASKSWWGIPAVVFADEQTAERTIKVMLDNPGLGLKPVTVVDISGRAGSMIHGVPVVSEIHGVPVVSEEQTGAWTAQSNGSAYAVIALPGASPERLSEVMNACGSQFSRTLVIPHLWDFSCLWVSPKNIGGMLGLEISQHIHMPSKQLTKRMLDVVLTLGVGLFLLPLILAIVVLIKLTSPGPVLYGQRRVGRGSTEFKAWKFRSMVPNAEKILVEYLREHPHLQEEWERDHKLKDDPRVTRIGKLLRRTSLDELPQLWNVLRGDMSLVGPRPIVRAEIARYGRHFDVYTKVRSGLTGLWQVSGRSDTSYQQRVNFDIFYVRNWSVWLDLCILFRTIGVVLFRSGAY